jgi:hypothetical protein
VSAAARLSPDRCSAAALNLPGPSDDFRFKDEGRDFQVEVYLGPAVSPDSRTQMLAILDSLRTQPDA